MNAIQKTGMMISIFLLAASLTGCSGAVTNIVDGTTAAAIGESSGSGETIKQTESVKADEFDSVAVKAEAMEIIVEPAAGDKAEIELTTDKAIDNEITLDVHVEKRELQITVEEKSVITNKSQQGERKLTVLLPDHLYDRVTVQTEFGAVDASSIKAESVNITVDAGSITARDLTGKTTLETSAGEITVDGFKLDHDLTATADVGDIKITLDESPKSGTVSLHSTVGEVNADLNHIDYSKNSALSKEGEFGSGGAALEATVEVGSVRVDTAKS
ncbi:hypothetical protein D3P08_24340 [Paenibacillus nanensis]|uniref:DUF4097 domain-containing protein n=1 Tax=Paenibacillus nanensis TaxID=393251 RepID=A0A3A1ULF2_9BACL|nr:DUF4097 family beta strand repeat-containing protein [Paenibacillus nanensis]RIX48634.1 hypothetical protein D3P08_24340 [Paenibacillus nanensis]